MKDYNLKILPTGLLEEYLTKVPSDLEASFNNLHDAEISTDSFSFYTSVSAVFSSKIEGEEIELDSYIKHKRFGIKFLPDYTKKIDDLYNTYIFAKSNKLDKNNISKAHTSLSKHIVSSHQQGKIRTQNMYVSTSEGRIEYVAATPDEVKFEMEKFYHDIDVLRKKQLSVGEVFFFAAMIHLVFVKIHPWDDGNGRSGRLIEKWFLALMLGNCAWFLQSEKHYYNEHQVYYKNLRALGLEYEEIDYSKALPFLLMLPQSVFLNGA